MKEFDSTEAFNFTTKLAYDRYEVITKECVSNCNKEDLTISGALIDQSHFRNVTFKNCVFFASRIYKSQFIGCHFENCSWQFCELSSSTFNSCHFDRCHWETTSVLENGFSNCLMDRKTLAQVAKDPNELTLCFSMDEFFPTKQVA